MWRSVRSFTRLNRRDCAFIKQCSTGVAARKKQHVFYDSEVQGLLKSLTGLNQQKIFRTRNVGKNIERSVYQFVTEEELKDMQKEFKQKAEQKIQMPPVMDERVSNSRVLEEDPHLVGFDVSKFVFTDITYGVPDRERIIVVRDLDGTLRTADPDEQDRINHTYYPREGRKHYVPPLFEPEHLQTILGPQKYEYVLDRNCLQFEPDHPIYIRTAEMVYNHINENKQFSVLHSTRHYGPLVFYLCWTHQIDEFIIHQILSKEIDGAADTVKLYQKINNDLSITISDDSKQTIRNFAKSSAKKGDKIVMALEKVA